MPDSITGTQRRLQQLTTMVLTDKLPSGSGLMPAYLYTQTHDNQNAVLGVGGRLFFNGIASELLILDNLDQSNQGYLGSKAWIQALNLLGIRDGACRLVECKQPLNTLSESLALVEFAKREELEQLIIVAPPFHMLRAFMSIVSVVCKLRVAGGLKVYCQVGLTLPWNETVAHSQGTLRATRQNLIMTELDRVYRYQTKGDLLSAEAVLEYLAWRDQE